VICDVFQVLNDNLRNGRLFSRLVVYGLWFMVYGLWFAVDGLRLMVCGFWFGF